MEPALGVFPLTVVYLLSTSISIYINVYIIKYIFHLLGTRVAVDGREDEFCLSCIISMSRNSTREFSIAQTNTGK